MSIFKLSNGEELFYEDVGSGDETIVMMHGWTSSSAIYKSTAEAMKGNVRSIIYDHRGHGGSKSANTDTVTMETLAQDLNEIITGLSLDNITLLGWSMGACAAMNYVSLYGCGALKRLILCDMTPKLLSDEEWKLGINRGTYTLSDMEAERGKDFLTLYKAFAINAVPKLRNIPGFLLNSGLKKELAKCDEKVLRSLSASMKSQDNRDIIEKIDVPLCYFYADPGSLFLPELAEWYKANCRSDFSQVRFSGTHMFIKDDPQTFTKELLAVLES